VPIILDNKQAITSYEVAEAESVRIAYPVMVKAAAGGGGRGMRVVRSQSELRKAYNEAKGEALTAFGDDEIFIELKFKYLATGTATSFTYLNAIVRYNAASKKSSK